MKQTVEAHLVSRYVSLSRYHLSIDERERVASFMLFSLSGQLCGFQQYRPDRDKTKNNDAKAGRYYTYKTPGQIAIFGLETIHDSRPIFLTEGIFDCIRLHNIGLTAVAGLSNDPKFLSGWIRAIGRPVHPICDSGKTGEKLAEYDHGHATCPEGHDLGSMSHGAIFELIRRFINE